MPPSDLGSPEALIEALDSLAPSPSGIYVHIDLDVLDSEQAPVNVYSAPGGLSGPGLSSSLLEAVLRDSHVDAVSLTAYDPECDPDARVPPIAARCCSRSSAGTSRDAPTSRPAVSDRRRAVGGASQRLDVELSHLQHRRHRPLGPLGSGSEKTSSIPVGTTCQERRTCP